MATRSQYISLVYGFLLITGRSGLVESDIPKDLMVCRPVTEVFSKLGHGKVDRGLLPFFRGPAGPPGPHGQTGSIGTKGEPDEKKILGIVYDQMRQIYADLFQIEMKLYREAGYKAATVGENDVVRKMLLKILPINHGASELTFVDAQKKCMDQFKAPINIGSMCYSVIGGDGLSWEYEDAKSNCTNLGGYPADLNSGEVYKKLYDYVDSSFSTEIEAWTGMRFQDDKLLLTNGTEASYSKWLYPYPRRTTTSYGSYYKTYIGVTISIDSSSRVKGIENTRLDRRFSYAICHFSLDGPVPTRSAPSTTTPSDDYNYDSD